MTDEELDNLFDKLLKARVSRSIEKKGIDPDHLLRTMTDPFNQQQIPSPLQQLEKFRYATDPNLANNMASIELSHKLIELLLKAKGIQGMSDIHNGFEQAVFFKIGELLKGIEVKDV